MSYEPMNESNNQHPLTFGSLFAGIGGIDLGLDRAGFKCIWQVEKDDYRRRVLAKHWPDVPKFKMVQDVGRHNLTPVDLIAGGYPCQPYSVAGKQKGEADNRNLWPEFIRIVREMRPRWVLAENVPGIIKIYLDTVLSDLESANYTAQAIGLPACSFDAPHRRQRIFVVAHTTIFNAGSGTEQFQGEKPPYGKSAQLLSDPSRGSREAKAGCDNGNVADAGCPRIHKRRGAPNAMRQSRQQGRVVRDGVSQRKSRKGKDVADATSTRRFKNGDGQSWRQESSTGKIWSVEPNVGRVAHGIPSRVDRLSALGDAVVPVVAEHMGLLIRQNWDLHNEREQ